LQLKDFRSNFTKDSDLKIKGSFIMKSAAEILKGRRMSVSRRFFRR